MKLKQIAVAAAALLALVSSARAHTVALGWTVLPNGDVTFYDAHWHGALGGPAEYLTIDGINYNFTSVENNLPVRTGLDGALWNPTYYSFDSGAGTLTANPSYNYDDWLVVTVSGLTTGSHTFTASTAALTYWNIPSSTGNVEFTLPPPPAPDAGSTVAMLGLALCGFAALRRKLSLA